MAGLHFFYPVSLKNITELIVNDVTSGGTISKIIHFLKIINKEHLLLNERNGFILNKIFLDFQNEAFLIVTEKKVTMAEMDIIVRKHFFPLGVFEFCDSVGNDVMLTSIKNYISDYNERDRYLPFAGMLDQMVQAGKLGMKSHAGFYLYPTENKTDELLLPDNRFPVIEKIINRLNNTLVASIEKFSHSSGISPNILNSAMKEYLGCDRDLFSH
jgi:3-hydroxyacyl-CoA dehydrogenase